MSNEGGGSVSGYAIGKDGTLSELPGSPYSAGDGPHGTAITKDGRRMYVPASNGGTIAGFRIGADGSLSPLPGSPYNGPGSAALLGRAVLSPDDRHLFQVEAIALSSTSKVYAYSVESDGSLVREPHPGIGTGVVFSDGPSAHFTPNQGPNAALKVSSVNGRTWTYSAEGSYDTDGDVVRYRWAFGDGATALTTTPSVDHTYTEAGSWSVTVTVIDDEGCSNRQVYTGIVVTCNGGSQARSTVHAVVG